MEALLPCEKLPCFLYSLWVFYRRVVISFFFFSFIYSFFKFMRDHLPAIYSELLLPVTAERTWNGQGCSNMFLADHKLFSISFELRSTFFSLTYSTFWELLFTLFVFRIRVLVIVSLPFPTES